jgi:fructose-bisphosphate aldolase, class I
MHNRILRRNAGGDGIANVPSKGAFLAALDQSGGSTPKALELYGISPSEYETGSER